MDTITMPLRMQVSLFQAVLKRYITRELKTTHGYMMPLPVSSAFV